MNFIFSSPDYLLLFLGIFNFIMAIFIFANDPKNRVNISFAAIASALTAWSLLLFFFRNVALTHASVLMRSIYVSGIGIAVTIWYFVHVFPNQKLSTGFRKWGVIISTIVVIVLMYVPGYIVRDTATLSDGSRTINLNPVGYYTFVIYFIFFYAGGLVLFWRRLKTTSSALLRKQSTVLFFGILILLVFGGFFNVVLPSPLFLNYHYIHLGPVFTFFVVLAVGYGVARLQLMNMKALVTEFFVVALILSLGIEIIFVKTSTELFVKGGVLGAVIVVGFLLIGSVINEVKQREQLQKLTESLEQSNLRLQQLDHQKTEFLSIASHQLRTPLSIINGFLELLEDGAYGKMKTDAMKVLHNMDETNLRLIKLVDEFLNITRIEQGRVKFTFSSCDLNMIIGSVVKELSPRTVEKKIKVVWKLGPPLIIKCDEEKIRHVVFNLIDNAGKYSEHGTIVIRAERDEKGISIKVEDQGIGFDKVDQASFFQKFYRGKNVEGINVTGTGIGLYICAKFIEAHGGRIWAKSKGLGKGSEFGFWIPFDPPLQPEEKILPGPLTIAQVV